MCGHLPGIDVTTARDEGKASVVLPRSCPGGATLEELIIPGTALVAHLRKRINAQR